MICCCLNVLLEDTVLRGRVMSGGAADVELLAPVTCDLVDGVSAKTKLCVCNRAIGMFTFRFVCWWIGRFFECAGYMGIRTMFSSLKILVIFLSNPSEINRILKCSQSLLECYCCCGWCLRGRLFQV